MALTLCFRNQTANLSEPLYVKVGQGMVRNRLSGAEVTLTSLQAAMRSEGYLAKPGEIDASPTWEATNTGWWSQDAVTPLPHPPHPDNTPSVIVDAATRLPVTGDAQNPSPPAEIEIDFTDQQLASAHGVRIIYHVGAVGDPDVVLDVALTPGMTDAFIATRIVFVLNNEPQLISSGSRNIVEVEPIDGVTLDKLEVDLTKT